MTASAYIKPQTKNRIVATATLNGAGEVILPLNKDFLTTEWQLVVEATQAFTGAPTAAGNGAAMIERVVLETSRGQVQVIDGESLDELSSFTEQMKPADRFALGQASTMRTAMDVHAENDGALHDLLTAIETVENPDIKIRVTLRDPAAAGVFTGGAGAGAFSFAIKARDNSIPDLTGSGDEETFAAVDQETGEIIEVDNGFYGIASLVHRVSSQVRNGASSGAQQPIRLQSAGNLLRFLQLVTFDTTGALPARADNIVSNIRLVVAGEEARVGHFVDFQNENEAKRGVSRSGSGVAVLDFGDMEDEYLDMTDNKEALLYIDVDAAAPAGWEIRIAEDYTAEA